MADLPEAFVIVRDTDEEPDGGGWIVDCDCEGPLSYSLEPHQPLFTADQLEAYAAAKVAEERERLTREVAALHMAQSVNNQNYPRAWHDGVDAALDAIRGTEAASRGE